MGRIIAKFDSQYCEWSTIVDAPVTYLMSLEDFKAYYLEEYGKHGMLDLDRRLERVELTGTSSLMDSSVDELIQNNRAGEKEKCLTKQEIIDNFQWKGNKPK